MHKSPNEIILPHHCKHCTPTRSINRLHISTPHTHTPSFLGNVVVIEVGTGGCTNRWAHMLLGKFIRLSHQHSGPACLDALRVCVCVTPLYRTGERQICLISFLITFESSSIKTLLPLLLYPPTAHLNTQTRPDFHPCEATH